MPGERTRRRTARRLAVTGLGVVLAWGALGAIGYIAGWQLHADNGKRQLLAAEGAATRAARAARAVASGRSCQVSATTGQLAGELRVPALHLTAPVEEGTGDAQLSVAVGHAPSSVWPGQSGTSVLLAHDVSYFVHLDALEAGDRVVFSTPCGSTTFTVERQQVVDQGTPIPSQPDAALVLDTCYPPNALFFTTQRLLVWATESPAATSAASTSARSTASTPGTGTAHPSSTLSIPAADRVTYSVPAPPALAAEGLTLTHNEVPMGTMTLAGQPSPGWEQSPGPMALEAAALAAYFGGLDAAQQDQPGWWGAIASPGVAMPSALDGATVSAQDAPLDVEIDSVRGVPAQVVLGTTVTLTGGQSPGTYAETVTATVHGSTVTLGGWALTPT